MNDLVKTIPTTLRTAAAKARAPRACFVALAATLTLTSALGCGSDSEKTDTGAGSGPLYGIMYEVFDDVGSTSYLSVLNSLDVEAIDTTKALEFAGGRAFLHAYDGAIFVGDAASPEVTRYSVGEDGALTPEGTVSFANYAVAALWQFDAWNVTFIHPHKAYLMDFQEGTMIIWDPTTMEITGEITGPSELYREAWTLEGTPAFVRDGLLFRTFNWANYTEGTYSTDLRLAIYDVETDELLELVEETRCPVPGNLVQKDEAGNAYFSNWIWPVAHSILRDAPAPCVLRLNAGEQRFDPEWTLDYSRVTDGHQGAMFTYLEDGQALVSGFYDERTSFDETTTTWSYAGSLNWRVFQVDLENGTGSPLEGLDFNGGAFTPARFDDSLFLMVPGGAEQNYESQVYQIEDGVAQPRVKVPGWSYQFVKLR
jgi:hypothetical protein